MFKRVTGLSPYQFRIAADGGSVSIFYAHALPTWASDIEEKTTGIGSLSRIETLCPCSSRDCKMIAVTESNHHPRSIPIDASSTDRNIGGERR
jgi:hypothetical protein